MYLTCAYMKQTLECARARERERERLYREKGRDSRWWPRTSATRTHTHTHTGRAAGLRKPRGGYNAIKRPTNHGLRLKREHDLIP